MPFSEAERGFKGGKASFANPGGEGALGPEGAGHEEARPRPGGGLDARREAFPFVLGNYFFAEKEGSKWLTRQSSLPFWSGKGASTVKAVFGQLSGRVGQGRRGEGRGGEGEYRLQVPYDTGNLNSTTRLWLPLGFGQYYTCTNLRGDEGQAAQETGWLAACTRSARGRRDGGVRFLGRPLFLAVGALMIRWGFVALRGRFLCGHDLGDWGCSLHAPDRVEKVAIDKPEAGRYVVRSCWLAGWRNVIFFPSRGAVLVFSSCSQRMEPPARRGPLAALPIFERWLQHAGF